MVPVKGSKKNRKEKENRTSGMRYDFFCWEFSSCDMDENV